MYHKIRVAAEPKSRARSMPQKVVINIASIGYEPFFLIGYNSNETMKYIFSIINNR